MIFTRRAFCRFACPLGAFYSIFNRVSLLQLKIDHDKCQKCNQCQSVCAVELEAAQRVQSTQCLRCFECIKACPNSAIKISSIFSTGRSKVTREEYAEK
jgi:polyferredoxin